MHGTVTFTKFVGTIGVSRVSAGPELQVRVTPDSSDGTHKVEGLLVLFFNHPADNIGYYNPSSGWMIAHLSPSEFDRVSELLRAGGELRFRWSAADDGRLSWILFDGGDSATLNIIDETEKQLSELGDAALALLRGRVGTL